MGRLFLFFKALIISNENLIWGVQSYSPPTWSSFYLKTNLPYRQDWVGRLVISRSVNLSVSLDVFLRDLCWQRADADK